eukprot:c23044_g1_i1 orf=626-5191(+)
MAARGQPNFGVVPEAAVTAAVAPPGLVRDAAVSPPVLEQLHSLRPLQHRLGDPLTRGDNSPRFHTVQSTQQSYGGAAGADPSSCFQYEDFAGILGERLASGNLSDVSASASEKVYSGYSSSGEHHGPRVKFMCSFGGRILPRPGDGTLRYAGGDTRIISVSRYAKYSDLMHKMGRLYGQPVLMKYQLPNEDLDALISISCDEDVENMMEEYDRLQSSEGSNRLRIFLFSPAEHDLLHANGTVDIRNTDQIYMDAINGMPETQAVPLSCSNILRGQEVPDAFSAPQIPNNLSYVLPVMSNPQLLAASVGMHQPNNQLLTRILSASPPTPPSPTIPLQLPQIRQPGISDASHSFYGDHLYKGPAGYLHEPQRMDASYQDFEGVGSGTSSLNSQQEGLYRHFDAMRLTDSPTKAQLEMMLERPHHQEQLLAADSMLPKVSNVMPQPDLYDRLPMSRVGSNRSLMTLQQQQVELSGPIVSDKLLDNQLSDTLQSPLDMQNLALQGQGYLSQSAWQHPMETRQEGFQRVDPVQLSAPENMQGLAVAPQQLRVSQYPSPVVIPSHEGAAYNQLDPSGGVTSGALPQKPLTVQTNIHSPGKGLASVSGLHQGSAPSSPRVKFQDINLNHSGIHPFLACREGCNGGFVEQPSAPQFAVQPQIEPVLRGLKPLNTRLDPQEQLFLVDDQAARQQLPSPLSKHQEIRGAYRQQAGEHLQNYYADGLIQPRTPPFPGSSPYREHLTPFADHRLVRGERQEQVQHDDGFGAYSNRQEGIDWTMMKVQNEKASMGWTGLGQVDSRGEASSYFDSKIAESSPVSHTLESSFINPLLTDAAYIDPHVPSKTSFMPSAVAVPPPVLDGVKISSASTYLPSQSELLFTSPTLVGGITEDQVWKAPPLPAANMPTNTISNSFFVANLEEGQWVKGLQTDARNSEEARRLSIEDMLEINENPFFDGRLSRQTSDKDGGLSRQTSDNDICAQDEPLRLPVVEGGNTTFNRSKPNDALYAHVRLPTSLDTPYPVDLSSLQTSPLSPRISADYLPMGSPSLSLAVEAPAGSSCLTEVLKDYECGDFVSCIERDDLKFLRPNFIHSDKNDRPVNTQNLSFGVSPRFSNVAEAKDDLPIFDSDSVEESENKDIRSNRGSVNAEVDVLPPTLYSDPTLSMQNWEESLATARLEDLVAEKSLLDKDIPDNIELHVLEKETLEIKVGGDLDDADGNNANANPAAIAEAEAVSRGLQTIKNADLEELRELGSGTFGTVYYGKWRGTDVAIKRIKSSCFSGRPSERDRLIADFWKEAYILGQLHHPNVVAFYGVVPDGPGGTLATVTEYMVNGSLKQVLQKKDRTIDRRKRLLIIMDAAFGMEYLHGKNIVHFDLKCENLLVNMKDPQRPICKVADLGLSKVKHQTMVSGGVRGTLPWMAPELLNGSSSFVSEKVDVFSFGIVMWELLTGEEPYANMHYGAIIGGIVNNTLRPPIPSWCDPSWKALMEKCWSADPGERPVFLEIAAELRAMANAKSQGQVSGMVSGDSTK